MAKFPGKRGRKAKTVVREGKHTIRLGVAPGKRMPPPEFAKVLAGRSGVQLTNKRLLAMRLALDGLDDDQIARIAGVSRETFEYWKWQHKDLADAIENGRTAADAEVVATLFQLATGFEKEVQEVHGKDADVVRYKKYYEPNLGAIKTWLRMRSNKRFKEEPQRLDVTSKGKPLGDVPKETKADIINSIVAAVRPKPDNEKKK